MFITLGIHYVKPEHVDDLLAAMRSINEAAHGAPGLLKIGAWRDILTGRVVGVSIWESREAFEAAQQRIFAATADLPFDEWEERPRDVLLLEEATLPPFYHSGLQ